MRNTNACLTNFHYKSISEKQFHSKTVFQLVTKETGSLGVPARRLAEKMELAHENGHAEVDATRIRRMKDRKKAHLVMPGKFSSKSQFKKMYK